MAFVIGKKFPYSGWILVILSSILLLVIYILFIHLHLFTLASLVLEIDVLHEENVGVYNIKVIQSDSSEALVAWLNDGGFYFEEKDVKVFDDYVKKDWCFVVAQLAADAVTNPDEIQYQGLAAPLLLRFQCQKPVYPLTLTGTGGCATEILIYLAAETYMTCDANRLEMKYAGEFRHWNNRYDEAHYSPFKSCDPEGFIQIGVAPKLHLIKYKGLLTPDQMNTDLTFTSTDEDISYREHIIVWSEEDLQ